MLKNPPANAGDVRDVRSLPGSGRFPGESHGRRNLVVYGLWRHKESDTTEAT